MMVGVEGAGGDRGASWSWGSFLELGGQGKLLGAGGDRGAGGAGVLRRLLEVGQLFGNS